MVSNIGKPKPLGLMYNLKCQICILLTYLRHKVLELFISQNQSKYKYNENENEKLLLEAEQSTTIHKSNTNILCS